MITGYLDMYNFIITALISVFGFSLAWVSNEDDIKMQAAMHLVENAQVMENIKVPNLDTNLVDGQLTPDEIRLTQANIKASVETAFEFMKTIKWKKQFARAYTQAFTIEEMNQLAAYYAAPESNTQPAKQAEFVEINQSIVNKEVNKYIAQIKNELDATFAKLAAES